MKVKTLINVIPYEDDTRYKRITFEQVKKACGKRSCRICGGERLAPGPYWYKCKWDADGRKKRTVYVGRVTPAPGRCQRKTKRWGERIFLLSSFAINCATAPFPAG